MYNIRRIGDTTYNIKDRIDNLNNIIIRDTKNFVEYKTFDFDFILKTYIIKYEDKIQDLLYDRIIIRSFNEKKISGYKIGYNEEGQIEIWVVSSRKNMIYIVTNDKLLFNTWQHIIIKYNGNMKANGIFISIDDKECKYKIIKDTLKECVPYSLVTLGYFNGIIKDLYLDSKKIIEEEFNPVNYPITYIVTELPIEKMKFKINSMYSFIYKSENIKIGLLDEGNIFYIKNGYMYYTFLGGYNDDIWHVLYVKDEKNIYIDGNKQEMKKIKTLYSSINNNKGIMGLFNGRLIINSPVT